MKYFKSSINNVNGDLSAIEGIKLPIHKKLLYFFYFLFEYFFEQKANKKIHYKINIDELDKFLGTKDWKKISPSRLACSAYIINFFKNNFSKDKKINILDLGCGKGRYYNFFSNTGYDINYIGFDINSAEQWNDLKNKATFFKVELGENKLKNIQGIEKLLNNIDLIFSHSALEHIKNDVAAISEVNELCTNAINLHLVPGTMMFINEYLHGWRRYNHRNFLKFKKSLTKNVIYEPIGNRKTISSFFPHHFAISGEKNSKDFFNEYKKHYNPKKMIEELSFPKLNEYPAFYALIIK